MAQSIRIVWSLGIALILFLFGATLGFLSGIPFNAPNMLFFCTIALIFSSIALISKNYLLSSLVLPFIPLYTVLVVDLFFFQTIGGLIIHPLNLVLALFVAIRDWKTMRPMVVIMASMCYISFVLSFSWFIDPNVFTDRYFEWNGALLTLTNVILYIILMLIVSTALFVWQSKTKVLIKTFDTLDLSGQQLSSLPMNIGALTEIKHLILQDNNLTTVPESIGDLQYLETLNLSLNKITTLPNQICKLPETTTINLAFNPIKALPSCLQCNRFKDVCHTKK